METLSLSVVVPVYVGAHFLTDLISEIDKVRNQLSAEECPIRIVEAIFINDDAPDDSGLILESLKKQYEWVRVIDLSRNYGQHPATMAGILHASGDWIVTMDEDLQHHPKFIPDLLEKGIVEQKDIVYANPGKTVHGSFIRDYGSRLIKWLLSKLTAEPNIIFFNSFRLMRGDIARATASVSINQTYFDLALSWFTTRITTFKVPLKDGRFIQSQKSGYTLRSLLSHSWRMIQTSNLKIMRIGSLMGFFSMAVAVCVAIYVLILKLFFPEEIGLEGWASIIISVLFLGGMNAFIIGLVLDNQSIILMRNHGKPAFFYIDRSSDKILLDYFLSKKNHIKK